MPAFRYRNFFWSSKNWAVGKIALTLKSHTEGRRAYRGITRTITKVGPSVNAAAYAPYANVQKRNRRGRPPPARRASAALYFAVLLDWHLVCIARLAVAKNQVTRTKKLGRQCSSTDDPTQPIRWRNRRGKPALSISGTRQARSLGHWSPDSCCCPCSD